MQIILSVHALPVRTIVTLIFSVCCTSSWSLCADLCGNSSCKPTVSLDLLQRTPPGKGISSAGRPSTQRHAPAFESYIVLRPCAAVQADSGVTSNTGMRSSGRTASRATTGPGQPAKPPARQTRSQSRRSSASANPANVGCLPPVLQWCMCVAFAFMQKLHIRCDLLCHGTCHFACALIHHAKREPHSTA